MGKRPSAQLILWCFSGTFRPMRMVCMGIGCVHMVVTMIVAMCMVMAVIMMLGGLTLEAT